MATDVLSRLVEIVSGLPLDAFFQKRIFAPLGMSDTGFYVPAEKYDRLATFYGYAPAVGLVDMALLDETTVPHFMTGAWLDKRQKPRFLSGGGGLVSSALDYLRFALMLRGRGTLDGVRLARPETVDLMTSPYLRPEQFLVPGCGCGFGLVVLTDPALAGIPVSIGAYAGSGAAGTEFWYDPGSDLLGIFMVQYASTTPLTLAQEFRILALQALLEA
jgi:CubicO group peptidase (beta-lactamase class C family)